MRMRKYFNLVLFLFLASTSMAQTPQTLNSADILLGLKKLKVIGSVLYVAAHPDDENTRLLAYLSKDRLYRTGYLSMTRGDGGQNLIGNEQGIELGMIRTQELLAARRMDGAEQFFTRAYDFGFSKTTDEALKIWEKEKILSDVVWVIRKFQPDVIMTRFPPDNRAGHGHHSASAVLAREAFDAAADPNRFPEHFKYGVKPWRAKRIMWNTFNFGTTNTTSNDQLKIDVGVYNPLLGKGYGEIASESRSQHKSQGFGVPRQRGPQMEFFTLTGGDSMKNDFAEGIVTDWSRYDGGAAINQLIDTIVANYSFQNPSASVKSLIDLYKAISKINDGDWKIKKLEEVKSLIEACAGLYLEAVSTEQFAVQGDSLHVNIFLSNRSDVKTSPLAIMLNNKQTSSLKSNAALVKNALLRERINFVVPANQPISQPYWLFHTNPKGSFTVNDQLLIGKAESDAAFTAIFSLNIEGEIFVFEKPVMYKFTDPVKGEIYQPLVVVPPIVISLNPDFLFGTKEYSTKIKIAITANKDASFTNPYLNFLSPDIDSKIIEVNQKDLLQFNKYQSKNFDIEGLGFPFNGPVNIFMSSGDNVYNQSQIDIKYDHIPQITYFRKTEVPSSSTRLVTLSKKIGYINGAGDKVAEGLMQMGYTVSFLEEKDITVANLKQYDAIVTGIRAYNVHPWLNNAYDVLMRYVKEGGVMLVQYNTSNQFGTIKSKMSPYPFNISRNRVTEEDAKVSFLAPTHPVLNYPNKITEKDFEGWVQERSVYEADAIDSNFVSILGMHDEGEPQRNGSLIVANYGKGRFVYSAVVFFRQLPAAVPGAYRLMANLLAKPK
ncbi:MAG: PIG-L family deacetylase [Chitinophagaceae bacterium]|nr:PIG-L family deacetylase [Chitinophagaceae bacterium]